MTVFRTAHQTRMDSASDIDKQINACVDMQVVDQRLTDNFRRLPRGYSSVSGAAIQADGVEDKLDPRVRIGIITPKTLSEQQLPQTFHPFEAKVPSLGSAPSYSVLVGDARPFLRLVDKRDLQVTNAMELEFMVARLVLGAHWMLHGPRDIFHISSSLIRIYSSWIANHITRRCALDLQEQAQIRILAAHFYQCLHSDREEIADEDRRASAAVLARHLGVGVNEVEAIIEYAGVITGLEDFVSKIKGWVKTPRLDTFNIGTLVTIISGSWFGIGGQQAACVAMEHPPTFAAMTYIAFDQRGYRRSTFADMVTKSFKGTGGEVEIVRSVNRIFDQWI